MKPFHLYHGDCLEVLRSLPAKSVDSLITDPPAGISFMGKDWDSNKGGSREWINWLTEVLKECRRVLKPGAHGFIWALPRTSHWTATAAEWAGLEIRDVVTHLFGSGFPKSLDISKAIDNRLGAERPVIGKNPAKRPRAYEGANGWQTPDRPEFKTGPASPDAAKWAGWGTGLKPASEHWIMVRRPIVKKSVAQNILKWGTGGINVDASRIEAADHAALAKNWNRTQSEKARGNAVGEMGLNPIDLNGRAPAGRFPANLVLDEEAVRLLDRQTGGASRFFMVSRDECGPVNAKAGDTFAGKRQVSRNESSSIDGYGNELTGLFQTDSISITKTATRSIMSFPILSVSIRKFIGRITIESERIIKPSAVSNIESVSVAENGNCLISFSDGKPEPIKGTVKPVIETISEDGGSEIESTGTRTTESIGAVQNSRFFYTAKAGAWEKNAGLTGTPEKPVHRYGGGIGEGKTPEAPALERNIHPTVKPFSLMRYLITMITPPGGTVLDPFLGSGTTGAVAVACGFQFIGIEKEREYFEIAEKRIGDVKLKPGNGPMPLVKEKAGQYRKEKA